MSIKQTLTIIIFLFSLSSQRLRGFHVPGKDSFIPINHGVETLIELTSTTNELYFSFDNKYDDSDIVVYVKNARQYTTTMYLYDSYDQIRTNEDGEYIGFVKDLDLSEKLSYVSSSKKCTYYIIIKDSGKYKTRDFITIFNEKDTLELREDQPFLIPMFFKNNLFSFSFSGEEDDVINLYMNINDKSFSQSIIILKNNVEIYRAEKNQGIIPLNDDKEKGEYQIYILSSFNEIYKKIKSSIVLTKAKSKVRLLEPEKAINLYYLTSNDFYFYLDLDKYEVDEENIITFKVSHNAHKNKMVQYCYATNMNFPEFNEDKFISNMPSHEEDSESQFSKLNSLDIIYHLYFSRKKQVEENKKSFLLVHCNVQIDDEVYFEPEQFSVFVSSQASVLDLSEKEKINEKINLKEYIPKIYKIKIPIKENIDDNKMSYVFYTNTKIQTIYENSMLNSDYNNEESIQLYAVSNTQLKNEKGNYKILYIKIFGGEQVINFRAESTESEIYYMQDTSRTYKTVTQQHLNCGDSFYFIGSYSVLATDSYYFLEEIYGKYDLYYRNEISDNDDDSILTNGNKQYLTDSKFGNLTRTFDIIELKCQNPGYFNLHILKDSFTDTLVLYQRQVAIVQNGPLNIIIPKLTEEQTKVNLEISTPLGKEIGIKVGDKEEKIDSNKRYYQVQYNKESIPEKIELNVKESFTIISTRLTDDNLYQIVDGTSAKINEENILFKLKNEQTYKSVNITINRVYDDYTFTMFRGDEYYGIDMILSGYDTIPLKGDEYSINLLISNPYLKANSMIPDKESSSFYIAFHVKDTEGKQKDISVVYNNVDEYEEWKDSIIQTLPATDNKRYSLKSQEGVQKMSILYQSCGNSLKEINLYNYDDIINYFENKKRFNLGVFNNYLIPKQICLIFVNDEGNNYTGAQISVNLKEISQKEIDDLNNDKINKISQNGKKLQWNKLNGAKEYTLYIFNIKNKDAKYIENICYLDSIIKENTTIKNETDPTYIGIYTTKENSYDIKEEGVYLTTVVANLEDNILLKFIFKAYEYDSSLPPHTDSDTSIPDDEGGEGEEGEDHTLLIVLLTVIPTVIIIILVISYILWKRKKKDLEQFLPPDEGNQALIRETMASKEQD